MLQFPADCGIPNGAVSGQGTGITGTPEYEWIGPGAESTNAINASVWEDLPSGWYYFSIEDDVCRVEDSIFLEQAPPPTASFEANPPEGEAPLDVTFVNASDEAETYIWDFGNGQGNTVNDQSNQNTTYTEPGVYTVTLEITEGECTDIATQDVIVTLVIPIEFDMPNVFTPNGDGVNDVFTLNPVNVVELEMTITNRWGNKVYETTDIEGTWNGRNQNTGEECTEGVYFYTFKLRGQNNEVVENHGFVHLVRD
jgi:gliding motility-associated-like protein